MPATTDAEAKTVVEWNVIGELPKVSILIPYYNRREQFMRVLSLLERQDYSAWYEIVVVDDGSSLDQNLWADINPNGAVRIKSLREPGAPPRSPNMAWNEAFRMSIGDFIITSHPEIIVPRNAISQMIEHHKPPFRSVPVQYCIATEHQYHRLERVPWYSDLNTIKLLPNFWTAVGPWGFSNGKAHEYLSHLSFSGNYRQHWQELSDDWLFLPRVEDPNFLSDDAWVHVNELRNGRPSRGVPIEVYHQWHERVYGSRNEASARIRRIIEADRKEASEWTPPSN